MTPDQKTLLTLLVFAIVLLFCCGLPVLLVIMDVGGIQAQLLALAPEPPPTATPRLTVTPTRVFYAISPTILAGQRAGTSTAAVSAPPTALSTATSTPKPGAQPHGTSTPRAVILHASATDLRVGDLITLTADMQGLGQPHYIVTFKDDTAPEEPTETVPVLQIQHDYDRFHLYVSKILQFESINYEKKERQVIAVFRGATPGSTRVTVGIYGETAIMYAEGKWAWTWIYQQSEDLAIRVTQ